MAANRKQGNQSTRYGNKSKGDGERYSADYSGYAKSYVPAEIDAKYKGIESADDLLEWHDRMVVNGYKVVSGVRKDGLSYYSELHDMDTHSSLAGWRLSAFADSPRGALSYLRFKSDVVFGDQWITEDTSNDAPKRG